MRYELKRMDPLRTANVMAILYGLMMGAFALIALPFFTLAAFVSPSGEFGDPGPVFLVILLLYPVLGVVMGWVGGLLTSAIYNFIIIRLTGGLLFELDGGLHE